MSLNCSLVTEAVNSARDSMFTLKADNGTGIDWDGSAGEVGFELELTGNT